MAAVPVAPRMTAEEFLARPFDAGLRWQELIDGEIVVSQPSGTAQPRAGKAVRCAEPLDRARRGEGPSLPPARLRLDGLNVFAPDISWYAMSNPVDVDPD